MDEIVQVNGAPIPIVLCANKVDLLAEDPDGTTETPFNQTDDGIREFAMNNGFFDSYRVSAKEDINIAAAFSSLTREMIIAAIA